MKKIVPVLAVLLLLVLGSVFFIRQRGSASVVVVSPTMVVSETSTATETDTPTATYTETVTPTYTATNTATATQTLTASSTLATRVFPVLIVNPGVLLPTLAASSVLRPTSVLSPSPRSTLVVPLPPPLSDVALAAGQSEGWVRYEPKMALFAWSGNWQLYGDKPNEKTFRSASGVYKYTDAPDAAMAMPFHGAAVRVRYVGCAVCGVFEVRVDGRLMRSVDSYYAKTQDALGYFGTTEFWTLANGDHLIQIVSMNRRNPASTGSVVGIDAIEVYRTDALATGLPTMTLTALVTPTLTASPASVANVVILQQPPALPPTGTQVQPVMVVVAFSISYDQQALGVAGAKSGVPGISVRMLDIVTNQVIASGFTDGQGLVTLSATTSHPVRLVTPYFGKVWELSLSEPNSIAWVIKPGNMPVLIP